MHIFRDMADEPNHDITKLPEYQALSIEHRQKVDETFQNTFLANQSRMGIKISQGIAFETAKKMCNEKYDPSYEASRQAWKATDKAVRTNNKQDHASAKMAHMGAAKLHQDGSTAAKTHTEQAQFHSNLSENVNLGEKHVGFKNLVHKLEGEGKSKESAGAIAASIGTKKYGSKAMHNAAKNHHALGEDDMSGPMGDTTGGDEIPSSTMEDDSGEILKKNHKDKGEAIGYCPECGNKKDNCTCGDDGKKLLDEIGKEDEAGPYCGESETSWAIAAKKMDGKKKGFFESVENKRIQYHLKEGEILEADINYFQHRDNAEYHTGQASKFSLNHKPNNNYFFQAANAHTMAGDAHKKAAKSADEKRKEHHLYMSNDHFQKVKKFKAKMGLKETEANPEFDAGAAAMQALNLKEKRCPECGERHPFDEPCPITPYVDPGSGAGDILMKNHAAKGMNAVVKESLSNDSSEMYKDHTKNPFHKTLEKHGFKHFRTDSFDGASATHHVYNHPAHGKSHVVVSQEHNRNPKHLKLYGGKPDSFLHRHEQENKIMSPSSGETNGQLHRTLSLHYGVPKGMKVPKLTSWEKKNPHAAPDYKMNEAYLTEVSQPIPWPLRSRHLGKYTKPKTEEGSTYTHPEGHKLEIHKIDGKPTGSWTHTTADGKIKTGKHIGDLHIHLIKTHGNFDQKVKDHLETLHKGGFSADSHMSHKMGALSYQHHKKGTGDPEDNALEYKAMHAALMKASRVR